MFIKRQESGERIQEIGEYKYQTVSNSSGVICIPLNALNLKRLERFKPTKTLIYIVLV